MILFGMEKDRLPILFLKKGKGVMTRVKYHGDYQTDLKNTVATFPYLKKEIDRRIKLFKKNPEDTRLENHPLKRNLEGKWAFSITDDVRIIFEWKGKSTVRFLAIGMHKEVYPQTPQNK